MSIDSITEVDAKQMSEQISFSKEIFAGTGRLSTDFETESREEIFAQKNRETDGIGQLGCRLEKVSALYMKLWLSRVKKIRI